MSINNGLPLSLNINRNKLSLMESNQMSPSTICCQQIKKKCINIESKNQQLIKECTLLNEEKIKLQNELNELNDYYNKIKQDLNYQQSNMQNIVSDKILKNESLIIENNKLHSLLEEKEYEIVIHLKINKFN